MSVGKAVAACVAVANDKAGKRTKTGAKQASESEQEHMKDRRPPSTRADIAQVIIQTILLVGALYGLGIYEGQLSEARRSNDLLQSSIEVATNSVNAAEAGIRKADESSRKAEESSRLDQRAWVTISLAKLETVPAIDEIPIVTLTLINSGKTPAVKLWGWGVVYISSAAQLSPQNKMPLGQKTQAVIGPNSPWRSSVSMRFPITDAAEVAALKEGNTTFLYATGTFIYEDIFGVEHRTHYCYRLRGKRLFEEPLRGHMWAAETGNSAD